MAVILAPIFLVLGCGSPINVADSFVAAYFVKASQERALELSTAVASEKLKEELRLVASIRQSGYGPAEARGQVTWKRLRSRVEAHQARVDYQIVVGAGIGQTKRRALISLREVGGRWKVSNFQVLDFAGAAP